MTCTDIRVDQSSSLFTFTLSTVHGRRNVSQNIIRMDETEHLKGTEETLQCEVQTPEESRALAESQLKVWKGFMICIPYSASIGGTATLTGTTPNLILAGHLKRFLWAFFLDLNCDNCNIIKMMINKNSLLCSHFPDCDLINFGSWFGFAFPLMLLFLILGWLWIAALYGGLKTR